ncbi:hypothetical protein HAZT_HAZT011333 [Hyalella azteca]|nr:hypothetical protein HAZT_HAZT011333 [Hyalella azteca]
MCTVERAKRITRVVWLFAVCYCGPWLFLTEVVSFDPELKFEAQECTYKLSRDQYLYYYFLDLIVFYVVPLLLSCVVYTLIARILFKSSIRGKTHQTSIETHTIDQKRPNAARIQVDSSSTLKILALCSDLDINLAPSRITDKVLPMLFMEQVER